MFDLQMGKTLRKANGPTYKVKSETKKNTIPMTNREYRIQRISGTRANPPMAAVKATRSATYSTRLPGFTSAPNFDNVILKTGARIGPCLLLVIGFEQST